MFNADVSVLSWVDRNGRDIPDDALEVTVAFRVRRGSLVFQEVVEAARSRRPIRLAVEVE